MGSVFLPTKFTTMRKLLLIILLLPFNVWAQINLVPNPSFEDTVSCPDYNSYASHLSPGGNMFDVKNWYGVNMFSPDYYNECTSYFTFSIPNNSAGYQQARTGSAYCGLISYVYSPLQDISVREYIHVKLDEENELKRDSFYHVGFYFSASDFFSRITPDIGMQFSSAPLDSTDTIISFIPDYTVIDTTCIDSVNTDDWILVEGIYKANGGENYLTIGNFRDNNESISTMLINNNSSGAMDKTYLLIDDVFVMPIQDSTSTAITELQKPKQLLRIIDVLGREAKPQPHVPLFYIYDDGTVEKRIVVE